MSAPGRWLRLDVGCFESEWLAALDPVAQHAWTRLLLHVKGVGVGGSAKRMGPTAVQKVWAITPLRFHEMENAALKDGALRIEDGWWVVTGWDKYQKPDRTNSIRQKNFRDRIDEDDNAVTERYAALSGVMGALPVEVEVKQLTSKATSKPTAPTYTDDFMNVWSLYPRGSKAKAFAEYRKAVPARITHPELATSYQRYVEREVTDSFAGWDTFRWIRDGRWEQYLNGNGVHHDSPARRILR